MIGIGKVIFKKQDTKKVVRKPSVPFFKKKSYSNKKQIDIKRRNGLSKFSKAILFILIAITALISIFFLGKVLFDYILRLRNIEKNTQTEIVVGFDIPSYPGSVYIFEQVEDDDTVKLFQSLGNSVYRLPKNEDIANVFDYYDVLLPTLGWSEQEFVPLTSEEKLYGQYWIKENKGLRIYSRLNDVWYQSITTKQAQDGLSDVVKKETARKLLLLTTEKTDLLPDYPWKLKYPTEYSTKYYASSIPSYQSVSFQKLGTDTVMYLEPQLYTGSNTQDGAIEKALVNLNKKLKSRWKIVNSKESIINDKVVVQAVITDGKKNGVSSAIVNEKIGIIYTLTMFVADDPFYDYILKNLKEPL